MNDPLPSLFSRRHERFFFLFGKTDDEFFAPAAGILRLEEILHLHFTELGYERIIFFNGKQKLYFYDELSRQRCLPASVSKVLPGTRHKPLSKMCPGPLGFSKIGLQAQPKSRSGILSGEQPLPARSLHLGSVSDMEMVSLMDRCMRDKTIKSVLIFTDGLDFIHHTESGAIRQMAANLNQWGSLFSDNENLCLFIFPDIAGTELHRLIEQSRNWSFLAARLLSAQAVLSPHCIRLGSPRQDEVAGLIHYFRLTKNLETDWLKLDSAIGAITKEIRSRNRRLKDLSAELKFVQDLQNDTLTRLAGADGEPSALERLRGMKGLEPVADKIERLLRVYQDGAADALKARTQIKARIPIRLLPQLQQSSTKSNLHLVLTGNPGTGKTTAALMLGEIFRQSGLLESGQVIKASREDLVAGYVGQTAIKTREKIEQALGGVLFIDEAYRLTETGAGDFGMEALETVMEAMHHHLGEFSVIIAGYPDKIEGFLNANPGLRRRFGQQNMIHIPDYPPQTLKYIFQQAVARRHRRLDPELEARLDTFFDNWLTDQDPTTFGNAGDVLNLVQEMDELRALRASDPSIVPASAPTITQDDVPERLQNHLKPRKPADLETVMASLEGLVGLKQVKDMIRTMVNRLTIEQLRFPDRLPAPGHYLFVGNPGTGKTTVARKMGEIFKAMGLLSKGHLIETGRSDLVAGYQGQTALKTREVLERSLDGVLFIDEAYQLVEDERDFFGKEALETMIAYMENQRSRLCIIAAGYPQPMSRFVQRNPGLPSRFSAEIKFDNYSAEEMLEIFRLMAASHHINLKQDAAEKLNLIFHQMAAAAGPYFGNGREVRKLFDSIAACQANRLAHTDPHILNQDKSVLYLFEKEDIPERD